MRTITKEKVVEELTVYVCEGCGFESTHQEAVLRCEERHKCQHESTYCDVDMASCDDGVRAPRAIFKMCSDCYEIIDAVMPRCDFWPAIIEANMKAAVDTTHEYGKKASPAVGRL